MSHHDGSLDPGPISQTGLPPGAESTIQAARILHSAAHSLVGPDHLPGSARYRRVATELEEILRRPFGYLPLHEVSPFVLMRDGTRKTLLSMLEEVEDDETDRLRLARLLLRSLEWQIPR